MTLHIFANVVTPYGTASNNRGENDGNTTTLQKLVWKSNVHTTVSAESIRFALRRLFAENGETVNRRWIDGKNTWQDAEFQNWQTYMDDDLLGFMNADGVSQEGEGDDDNDIEGEDNKPSLKGKKKKGPTIIRRGVLEITRSVSLTPWHGDVSFNAASPGASKAARNENVPAPYLAELHATRYQFGLAMTPQRLAVAERAQKALQAIGALRCVAGNHGRFLYDFSPEVIVIRITDDPAPRILYCFDTPDGGKTVSADALLSRIETGDIVPDELFVGVSDMNAPIVAELTKRNVAVTGVRKAIDDASKKIAVTKS